MTLERFNESMKLLFRGEWEQGFADYELRLDAKEWRYGYYRPELTAQRWDGSPLDARLYLHGEGGAGDVLMMSRYIPLVRPRVQTLILDVLPSLVSLFRATYPDIQVVPFGDGIAYHERSLSLMSLPAIFRTTPDTVPPLAPFTIGETEPVVPGRIGVCWQGNPAHANDHNRSMPLHALSPLLALPSVEWQCLQYGAELEGLIPCPSTDYLATARAIKRCELVITVDTSIAHLAGCLGVPTWILLPFEAEWRWLEHRIDTPWYPSACLWRQETGGDWDGLIARVVSFLERTEALAPC